MMRETITVPWAGLLQEEREKISTALKKSKKSLPPVPALQFTGKRYSKRSDILMKSILPILRILMWATGLGSMDMRTGLPQRLWCTIWEAEPVVPGTTSLRQDILPGIIFT